MIYIGNGIYSDSGPNDYLQHYGVLGMKWGVHKAKVHLRNIRYGRNSKAKSIGDIREATAKYKEDVKSIKEFAKKNKKNKAVKISDIEKIARDKARSHYGEGYDALNKKIRRSQLANYALTGAGAGLGAASMIYQGKQNRKWEKSHGLSGHMLGTHKYLLDNSKGTKNADALGYAGAGLIGASLIPQAFSNDYRKKLSDKFHE